MWVGRLKENEPKYITWWNIHNENKIYCNCNTIIITAISEYKLVLELLVSENAYTYI